jgi:UDP-3-O-[3-hydroxymyristoyl] glucosamine N-acyltransferase
VKRLAIVGVSNMLGDFFDCAMACGYTDFVVVINAEEVVRPRTRSFRDRIADLPPGVRVLVQDIAEFAPAPGDPCFLGTTAAARFRLAAELRDRFGVRLACLVHPAAYVSPLAALADGVFVGAGSVVGAAAELHQCAFVNRAASVGHDTVVGPYARVQPGVNVGGHVRIGAFVTVGVGASVFQETVIGDGALVAGGAVVTADVEARQLVAGVPAVVKKRVADNANLPTWQELEPQLSVPLRGRRSQA